MTIPLWSDRNPKIKDVLSATSETGWEDLTSEDKKIMWKYLQHFLFNPSANSGNLYFDRIECNHEFYGEYSNDNDHLAKIIASSINLLNEKYKRNSYARRFLNASTFDAACEDFYEIFITQPRDVAFELISIFSNVTIIGEKERMWKKQDETKEEFETRKEIEKWKRFDKFSKTLNEVLSQFGINYQLTRNGLIAADEPKVIEKIYKPALKKLTNKKWLPVNRDLKDAFEALNKDKDGSGALTHTLAALQGFLQILVHDQTGKGDTSILLNEAIKKKLIPDDDFSKKIIKDMNSFWAKERQDKGDPHPKNDYATKAQAKLVISLVMVFVDHVL